MKDNQQNMIDSEESKDDNQLTMEDNGELPVKNQRHKCADCGKLFSRANKLNNHIKLVHTHEPCTCPFCGCKTLKNKSDLSMHIKKAHKDFKLPKEETNTMHEEEKIEQNEVLVDERKQNIKRDADVYECRECGKPFSEAENLNDHFKTVHIFEPCSCPFCEGTLLKNQFYLAKHLEQFHKNSKLPGETINNGNEKQGIKMNQLDEFYEKSNCDVKNEVDIELKQSIETVIEDLKVEKPFICDLCSQTFTTKRTFEQHKFIHTGKNNAIKMHKKKFQSDDKPIVCDFCPQTFVTESKFLQHKRLHTGEKPYQCDECEKSFRLKFVMKNHKKKIHGPAVDYLCPQCGKSFEKKMALGGHMATAHPSENQYRICLLCDKEFKNAAALKQHQRKHIKQSNIEIECICEQCGKTCKNKRALFDHTRGVHLGKYKTGPTGIFKCSECYKEFGRRHALYNHNYYTHTFQNIACPSCGKTCKNKLYLRRHIKRTCSRKMKMNLG